MCPWFGCGKRSASVCVLSFDLVIAQRRQGGQRQLGSIGRSQSRAVAMTQGRTIGSGIGRSQGVSVGRNLGHQRGGVQQRCRGQDLGHWSHRLDHGALAVHHSIETVHGIGGVLHNSAGAIGLDQGVGALHHIAAAALLLALHIASGMILEGEFKRGYIRGFILIYKIYKVEY